MPFLGQDWRSPGEQWVKTAEGWEKLKCWRMKLLCNLSENVCSRLLRLAHRGQVEQRQEDTKITQPPVPSQPHLLINKSSTRELKSQVSLADVFTKLDMTGAVRDLRRFNYVCKMIDLLICYKLSQVSGTGQKYMFLILQEILTQVTKTNTNLHIMQKLLNHLKVALLENHYSHVGSFKLWEKHREVVEQMQNQLSSLQLKQREDDGGLKLSDLPDDCVREILQRLSDAGDIVNTGMTESRNLSLSQEQNLWKAMCLFHFNNIQIRTMMPVDGVSTDSINWQRLYRKLYKRYGKKECYAEMLNLCNNCHTVFWEHHGHPCLNQEVPESASPLSPAKFIQMFT